MKVWKFYFFLSSPIFGAPSLMRNKDLNVAIKEMLEKSNVLDTGETELALDSPDQEFSRILDIAGF